MSCGATRMFKPSVTALSDDEGVAPLQDLQVVPAVPAHLAAASKKRKSGDGKGPSLSELRGKLGKLGNATCACSRASLSKHSCFKQFQGSCMDGIFQLVWRLRSWDKQDMDNEAC